MSYYDDPIQTEHYQGFRIDILPDEDPPNPQRDYEPFGVMVCFHGSYDLGSADHGYSEGNYTGWQGLHDAIAADHPGAVILPLALLDHSGITMQVGSGAFMSDPGGWDSGSVGFIFASREEARDAFGIAAMVSNATETALRAEVEEYDRYLRGEAYGFTVTAKGGERVGSCWGFSDVDDALAEARATADCHLTWLDRELDDVRDVTKGIALVALAGGAS